MMMRSGECERASWAALARQRLWLVVLVLGALGYYPGMAWGDSAYRLEPGRVLGEAGSGAGGLSLAAPVRALEGSPFFTAGGSGVAVGDGSHDVFVADTWNSRVDVFGAGGGFVRAWGWGVQDGESKPEVCTGSPPGCKKGLSGSGLGELAAPRFVAVDNSSGTSAGDVYVGVGVGSEAANERELVEVTGATEGSYTLGFEDETTSAVPYSPVPSGNEKDDGPNAQAAQAALEGLATIGAGHVKVREEDGDPSRLAVEFEGALGDQQVGVLTCGGSGLVGAGAGCGVAVQRVGSPFVGEVLEKFSPEGELFEEWGAEGQLDGLTAPAGAFKGQLNGLAVDSSGHLWVYDAGELYEFNEEGTPIEDCRLEGPSSASGLAAGPGGELFLVRLDRVEAFSGCAGFKEGVWRPHSPAPSGVAVDGLSGEALADLGDVIEDVAPGVSEPLEFGAEVLSGGAGLAVNTSTGSPFSGSVYAANTATSEVDVFGVSMEARTTGVSSMSATDAALEGEVNPRATNVTGCVFHYANGAVAPCLDEAGERVSSEHPLTGEAPVKVHAAAEGLSGGTSYDYSLRATNTAGEALESETKTFKTLTTAVIEDTATEKIEAQSALLTGKVNPKSVPDTKCSFEYGLSEAYEHQAPCEPSETLSGSSPVAVSLALTGLTPGSEYHWRITVTDENVPSQEAVTSPDNTFVYLPPNTPQHQQTPCPNETLRGESDLDLKTGQALSLELPDCRAYELVTPTHKNGALLAPILFGPAAQVSEDGSRVIVSSDQCFAEAGSCTAKREHTGVPFEFSRTAGGWVTSALAPPASVLEDSGLWGYNANTNSVLYNAPIAGQLPDSFFARTPVGAFETHRPRQRNSPLPYPAHRWRVRDRRPLPHHLLLAYQRRSVAVTVPRRAVVRVRRHRQREALPRERRRRTRPGQHENNR